MRVGSAFHRMKDFHFYYAFCLPPAVHLDKQVAIPCFFNSFQSSPCRKYFFYDLALQTSSKDSLKMNMGKFAASFSESDSDRFHLVLLFEDAINARHHSSRSPTCVGNEPRRKPIHLG